MSEIQVVLTRIAALRQQLEQAKGLTIHPEMGAASCRDDSAGEAWPESGAASAPRVGTRPRLAAQTRPGAPERETHAAENALERLVAEGSKHTVLLDRALRQLTADRLMQDAAIMPKQLTARARRILEEGRQLLDKLRSLADTFELDPSSDPNKLANPDREDPLSRRYWETAAMANTTLRMVAAFPDSASSQLALCEGLETILGTVAERIDEITAVLDQRRRETDQVETLARLLTALYAKEPVDLQLFVSLAEAILAEAQQAAPLRFLSRAGGLRVPGDGYFGENPEARPISNPPSPTPSAAWSARFVACHSLTVAQVIARVVRHDPDFHNDSVRPILAALLHDAGMLGVPPAILAQSAPLDDTQRRMVEGHTRLGAELMARLQPDGSWLADAARGHHERLDGTGYPDGKQEAQLEPLTRLIAVCDTYAALCTARPHRPARDTRTALTDTLLLAEDGTLDRYLAERLLQLSFYPVGSVVELADGALGIVVATHMGRRDLASLARPVLALLTDAQGRRLPIPQHLDLAECEDRSIVRTVPQADCRLQTVAFPFHRPIKG